METVLTQISTFEEEKEVTKRVSVAQRTEESSNLIVHTVNPSMEDDVQSNLELKLDEILKKSTHLASCCR